MLMLGGCGRLGFGGGSSDASAADASADAAIDGFDAPSCMPLIGQMDEDFAAVSLDLGKWIANTDAGVTLAPQSGVLRVSLADAMAGSHYGTLRSRCAYDVRGHELGVRIVNRPTSNPSAEMALCFINYNAGYHQVCMDVIAGQLLAVVNDNDNAVTMAQRTFDAANDVRWRIKEQGGSVFMATSPDGMTWAPFFSLVSPIDTSQAHLLLLAGTFGSVASPGAADYDDVLAQ